jgi:cytoskeletal protein CcmA (bactofilin family)
MFWKSKKAKKSTFDVEDTGHSGHSIIAQGVHVVGDIKFCGSLRVEGRIDGKVSVIDGKKGALTLSQDGIINGPVMVTNLLTDGHINGNTYVEERLECRSKAVIRGEVIYSVIHIAEGASIEGRCMQRSDLVKMAEQRARNILPSPEAARTPSSMAPQPAAARPQQAQATAGTPRPAAQQGNVTILSPNNFLKKG